MSNLADAVLPLIRTRAELHYHAANRHGSQMHDAIDILEDARTTSDPSEVHAVTHKALASAIAVIARADDSSGTIGDAVHRLLELHPQTAAAAHVPSSKLITWMIKFQFDAEVDFFELDPVAYAPALGVAGVRTYRQRLAEIEASLGPRPSHDERFSSEHSAEWFTLDWNAQRLAVLDRDIDAIIGTHARDRKVAAWYVDTAKALEEIGEFDLAIDWARQATEFDHQHQSRSAADYWCELLQQHRPDELLPARLDVFRRWPSQTTATALFKAARTSWPEYREEVMSSLTRTPADAVGFTLRTLKQPEAAWQLAHSLHLDDHATWSDLLKTYEKIDATAVLPIHRRLVEDELSVTDPRNYPIAARRLATMRRLASGSAQEAAVDEFIAELRERYRRRTRMQQDFDRLGLP